MKNRMWMRGRFPFGAAAACALGLMALLAVPALGAEIPVKDYSVPVDLTGEGTAWCARYAADGRMLSVTEVGKDTGEDEQTALAKVFRVDQEMKPLSDAQTVYFTGWQERQQCGDVQMKAKHYDAAVEAYSEAIEMDKTQAAPYVGRGDARIQAGVKAKDLTEDKLEASEADYTTAKSLDAACAGAWLGLADVSIREGNIDGDGGAKAILEEGLAATGNDAGVQAKLDEIMVGNVTDSSGQQHRRTFFDGDGNLLSYLDFGYDTQGRMSSVASYNSAGPIDRIDVQYDENGRRLNYYITSVDGHLDQEIYQYDENGYITRERWLDRVGGEWQEIKGYTYTYYEDGNRATAQEYWIRNGVEEIGEHEEYFYDDAGHQIRRNVYRASGELYWYIIEDYNEAGVHTKHTEYGLRKQNGTEVYEVTSYKLYFYNDSGKLVRSEEYVGGVLKYVEEFS